MQTETPEWLAEEVVTYRKLGGDPIKGAIRIGKPYDNHDGSWACPVDLGPIGGRTCDIIGGNSMQALSLAVKLIGFVIQSVIDNTNCCLMMSDGSTDQTLWGAAFVLPCANNTSSSRCETDPHLRPPTPHHPACRSAPGGSDLTLARHQEKLTHMPISKENFELAFDWVWFSPYGHNQAYINPQTGALYTHTDIGDNFEDEPEDLHSGDWIEVPHKTKFDLGRGLVSAFASTLSPQHQAYIEQIFTGKGAYRRLKAYLAQIGKLDEWHQLENRSQQEAMIAWALENRIVISESSD